MIAALLAFGLVLLFVGTLSVWNLFVSVGPPWLFLTFGFVYAASAGAAWLCTEREDNSFAIALAPALLAPAVTLLAFSGGDVVGPLTPVPRPPVLSLLAVVFGLALSFPLGVAERFRRQWLVVVLLGLATVPLLLAALSALSPGPPEDRDLLVLVGMAVLTVAPLAAIPTYGVGRAVREQRADAASPYPPLAALALPYVLVLAGLAAAPYFLGGTVFGLALLVVPLAVLLGICVRILQLRGT